MTPSAMRYDFSDEVLVPFPFTSHNKSKKRPAVVVGSNNDNAARPDVVVMAITSQIVRLPGWGKHGLPSGKRPA